MAYTTVDDPSAYFHTRLYSGNGSTQSITNNANAGNFKPDWLWIKERTSTSQNFLFDSTRGVGKYLHSDSNSSEGNDVHNTSFDTNGFGVGQQNGTNENSQTYVAWQWKCNGGTTASNSNGSITSTVQVNDTAGFSIVTYTGNETAGATIGHGLSAAPDVVIVKNRESSREWMFGHQTYVDGGNTENLRWNSTGAVASADDQAGSGWHRTAFGSSVFTVGDGQDGDYTEGTNNGTDDHVAYCFREIKGYSKFGKYTGNGNADGPFVYTGFKPAWVMYKNTSSTSNWIVRDNKRTTSGGTNPNGTVFLPNSSNAESTNDSATVIDLLSNGFKIRNTENNDNTNGNTYIYMAFAEHPFVSSKGVPVTAR